MFEREATFKKLGHSEDSNARGANSREEEPAHVQPRALSKAAAPQANGLP
jgi:hypothetical protein